ncbi:MAG: AAA family ATPase, partial [Phycisphaerales bacterium]|nr:AAA family ATPase [Phycisphaerales bacterium]
MRLLSVELAGFRGFPQRHFVDLDADAVVIVGANGNGKTSLFDSVLWALSGRIPRLNNDDNRLVSMYADSGQARVAVKLKGTNNAVVTVTRSFDGTKGRVALGPIPKTGRAPIYSSGHEGPERQVQGCTGREWRSAGVVRMR